MDNLSKKRVFISQRPKRSLSRNVKSKSSPKAIETPASPNKAQNDEVGGYEGPEPTQFGDGNTMAGAQTFKSKLFVSQSYLTGYSGSKR